MVPRFKGSMVTLKGSLVRFQGTNQAPVLILKHSLQRATIKIHYVLETVTPYPKMPGNKKKNKSGKTKAMKREERRQSSLDSAIPLDA